MKKTILISTLFYCNTLLAQSLYNNGSIIKVENNAVLYMGGDMQNQAGSQFINDGTVIAKGNITNNEVMTTPYIGTWKLQGTALQNIQGASRLWVNIIEFDNAAGFVNTIPIKINGTANFINGIIDNTITNPIIFGSTALVSTVNVPTDISHVKGYTSKEGTGNFSFPVGGGTKYQKILANITANSNAIVVKYFPIDAGVGTYTNTGTESTPLTDYNEQEYWDVSVEGGGTATANITIYWDGYKDVFGNALSLRKVAHKLNNTNWLNEGTTGTGTTSIGSVVSNSITNPFGKFSLGTTVGVLPLNLLSFTATPKGNDALLNWKTDNEINVQKYDVERSNNNGMFTYVGTQQALVGSGTKNYSLTDFNAANFAVNKTLYYRLKMFDNNGSFKYSEIRKVNFDKTNMDIVSVYPNPTSGKVNIILNTSTNNVLLSVINSLGQLVKTQAINSTNSNVLDLTNLPNGTYFIKTNNGQQFKIVKQ
jgi:hypothetical protein